MNPLYQPRYIHMQDVLETKKFSGFTVAYIRNDYQLFFAYSLVNKKDEYIKAIGREISSALLENKIEDIDGSTSNISTKDRVGCITIEQFRKLPEITSMMADSLSQQVTFMDFKHSFLSSILASFVLSAIELTEQ